MAPTEEGEHGERAVTWGENATIRERHASHIVDLRLYVWLGELAVESRREPHVDMWWSLPHEADSKKC